VRLSGGAHRKRAAQCRHAPCLGARALDGVGAKFIWHRWSWLIFLEILRKK
jgi:hypothetical protein